MGWDEGSDWEPKDNLFSDYDGTVVEAHFGPTEFDAAVMALTLKMEVESRVDGWEERFTCGTGWGSMDGGETIYRMDGEPEKILKSSQYGLLLTKVGMLDGAPEVLSKRGKPTRAGVWVGMKFHWESVQGRSYKDRKTGEMVEGRARNYPSGFLGVAGGGSNGKVEEKADGYEPDSEVVEKLAAIAKEHDTHYAFLEKALKTVPEVGTDARVQGWASQEKVYLRLRG